MHLTILKRKILHNRPLLKRLIIRGASSVLIVGIFFLIVQAGTTLALVGLTPQTIGRLLFSSEIPLKNYQGKTNMVLLGMAGGTHAGADLVDTIIVATIDWQKKKIFLTSLPRDLWSDTLQDKINTSYHYGVEKTNTHEGGIVLTKAIVEELVGFPIHYFARIEFSGFKEIVDAIGGVDVIVHPGFADEKYPIEGKEDDTCNGDKTFACRYETVRFNEGRQHLDGTRALQYVRSREAEGEQGSDIARGVRQQHVLLAVREKLSLGKTLFAFKRNQALWEIVHKATETDMSLSEIIGTGKFLIRLSKESLVSIPLPFEDFIAGKKGILINPPEYLFLNRWVLVPKNNDATLIPSYITCQIEEKSNCQTLYQ